MNAYFFIIVFVLAAGTAKTAHAVPPPDFIFTIGSQIGQIFTFVVLIFSVAIGVLRRFFQTNPFFVRHRKLAWTLLIVFIVAIAGGVAYAYDRYRQQKAYTQWVQESRQQEAPLPEEEIGGLDKLKIGELEGRPGKLEAEDAGATFIRSYYASLDAGNLAAAYAVSSKTVPYETYRQWYANTLSVRVDSLQKISENLYSLGLTLAEKTGSVRYAVLMQLRPAPTGGFTIQSSAVRTLAQAGTETGEGLSTDDPGFYERNKDANILVENEEFQNIVRDDAGAYVLDAREDEEYEIGYFPGSHHMRFADLLAGGWIQLPRDRTIYVLCWSGIRGQEVAEFLRTKQLVARYLENGADGWVDYGGSWTGGIQFLSRYSDERYQIVFPTEEVRRRANEGVVLVDSRQPAKYKQRHIAGSISIPTIYTPTSELAAALAQVPKGSTVITVCDDFVSCFDAKITGLKLEKQGHVFLGRYNKPWDY